MNNIAIIHHNDPDGRMSAVIVEEYYRKKLSNYVYIDMIEMDYAKADNFDTSIIKEDQIVVIVDFSFRPHQMREIEKNCEHLIWIDHHITCKDYGLEDLEGLRDFEEKKFSGCELTWMYFNPLTIMPKAVRLIGDYDCWRLAEEEISKPFIGAINGVKYWREEYVPLLTLGDEKETEDLIIKGKTIAEFKNTYCEDLCNSYGYETDFEGHRMFVSNQYRFGSMGFGNRLNEYDALIAFIFDGDDFTISLYSEKIDVSVICKKYNGGGHKGAAGFHCKELPFKKAQNV